MKSSWTPSQRCCDRRMPLCLCWTHETHTHAHTHPDTATEAVTHTLIHKLWCVTPLLLLYLNLNICNLGAFPCHKSRVKPSLENWIWEILWVLLSRLWCSSTSFVRVRLIFEFLPPGPELKWKTKWHKMASASFRAVCSLQTQTAQAEMRPASILICIYPADDLLLSLCCWRHKLHPS